GERKAGPRTSTRTSSPYDRGTPPSFQSIQSVYTSNTTQFSRWFLFFSLNQSLPQLSTKLTIAISGSNLLLLRLLEPDVLQPVHQVEPVVPASCCRGAS